MSASRKPLPLPHVILCYKLHWHKTRVVNPFLSLTLRTRPEDVWVVVEVAGGSTVAESSSGPRRSDTPLRLSRGSPFSRASRLLPSTAPSASRFRPSSRSATNTKQNSYKSTGMTGPFNMTRHLQFFYWLNKEKLFHQMWYLLWEGGRPSGGPQGDGNAVSSSSDGLDRCTAALEQHLMRHKTEQTAEIAGEATFDVSHDTQNWQYKHVSFLSCKCVFSKDSMQQSIFSFFSFQRFFF